MLRSSLRRILSVVLVVVFPAAMLMADSANAMLYVSGSAAVNGIAASRSTAIFNGDAIQTGNATAVTISSPGSTVLVPANSNVVYGRDAMIVNDGTIVVNTTRGMRTQSSALTVTPAAGNAKFQVTREKDVIVVAAMRGDVAVTGPAGTTILPEGKSETFPDAAAQRRNQGPPPAAAAGGGGPSGKTLAIIGGVAAATAAAVAILTTGRDIPESGSEP